MRMTMVAFVSLTLVFQVCAENDFAQTTKTKSIRLIPTAKEGGANWKYMESPKRTTNWMGLTFNDKTWKTGKSGFGNFNKRGDTKTIWSGGRKDLYLRKEFKIDYKVKEVVEAVLNFAIDDSFEVWLNGKPLFDMAHNGSYEYGTVDVTEEFKRLFRETGRSNVIAVKAHDIGGACFVDVGLTVKISLQESATTQSVKELRVPAVRVGKRSGYGTYAIIDISRGADAANFPVTYCDQVPVGGWTKEHKTTKIVLRRVEPGVYDTMDRRKVRFTKPFYIGIFELTQKQIKLLSGDGDRKFVFEGDMRPADCVTWEEMRGKIDEFDFPTTKEVAPDSIIGRLRAKTGFQIDLPTSYQFGCAWNAGTDGSGRDVRLTGRHHSNQRDGRGGTISKYTIVGSYESNEWGIYDLHGNVWEMCLNRIDHRTADVEVDPKGPVEGEKRCLRGGCWNSTDGFIFSDFNPSTVNKEGNPSGKCGCRIVINADEAEEWSTPHHSEE